MYVKLVVLLLLLIHMVCSNQPTLEKTWAVQLEGGREEAQRIAQKAGVTLVKQILGDYYLFKESKNVRRARLMDKDSERLLKAEHSVKMVKEQLPHTRQLYQGGHQGVVFNDDMWHLHTYLHTGDVHMNILPAWERTQKGEGVVVGVIDDGIFPNQPDLRDNLAAGLSYNVLAETTDPTPSLHVLSHGTNCAGIIAAVHNNSFCGVGVAYRAKVAGIKLFSAASTELTDDQEASALSHEYQRISVFSCSWGPSDWNNALEGPDTVAKVALTTTAREGRDGKGSIFVFSTGNGGTYNDSCAYNGYVNTNNTIGIGGLRQDGSIPSFAEACTSVFAVALSRDHIGDNANVVVPHRAAGCGTTFSGTSPAAAMAAGVFTLVLSANDQLSVRDVQHLITQTSTNTGICGQTWKENSVGFRVSDHCGFGLLHAGKLTAMAANWSCVPEQVSCTQQREGASVHISQSGEVHTSITVPQDSCVVNYLEHVLLTVRITFPHRGHLRIRLTSPGGTVSDIVPGRATDMEPDLVWTFMSLHHWGERAVGTWQLSIQNTHPHISSTGILESWSLALLGTATNPVNSITGSMLGTDTTSRSVKTGTTESSPSSEVTRKDDVVSATTTPSTSPQSSTRLAAQTTKDKTTQPTTTKSHTTQPTTTKSHTTQPTTTKSHTTQPTTTKSHTTQPTTTKSHTTRPTTTKSHTTQQTTTKSHTTQPTTTKSHTTQPTTTKSHTTQPTTTKSHTTQPTTTKSHTTQPTTTKAHTSQPTTTKSHTTQPITTTKSHTTQPTTTKSHTTQPTTTKSHTTQPTTTKTHTSQPTTTKSHTTQPITTTKSHTTQPTTTKSHTTQPTTTIMQIAHSQLITRKTQTVKDLEIAQRGNSDTLLPGIDTAASAGIISCICIIILVIAAILFAIWHSRRNEPNSVDIENRTNPGLQVSSPEVTYLSNIHIGGNGRVPETII